MPFLIRFKDSSLPMISMISVAPAGVICFPETAVRTGHIAAIGRYAGRRSGRAGRSGLCGFGRVGRTDVHLRDGGALSFGRGLFG